MDILIAAGHLPSPGGPQAGHKCSYFAYEYLARRHRLHLIAFANKNEVAGLGRAKLEIFASHELLPVNRRVRLMGALTAPTLPLAIAARHSGSFRTRLEQAVRVRKPDLVIFDHTAMFQFVESAPATVVTAGIAHDVYTQVWDRKAAQARNPVLKPLLRAESRRMQSWETSAFRNLDLVIAFNEKDKHLIETLEPAATTIAVDPWMSLPISKAGSTREPGALIFWGAMDRLENVDAARWAAKELLPAIRQSVPHAKLYIAGNRGEHLAQEFAGREEIVVTGFVDDVGELMSRMEIALLPLRLGAGIKIKTLECMAAGLPVVTTSVGAEGVGGTGGRDYFVAEKADEIVQHTLSLLHNPPAAREMGARAIEFIAKRWDFEGRMHSLEAFLTQRVVERRDASYRKTLNSAG
jgi:polysaccharide biosynthesis protein PslH